MSDNRQALYELAQRECARIKQLEKPVVRVCGPLTADGPEGYERNAARLAAAEEYLQAQGLSVWTFGESQADIFGKGYDRQDIFDYFHRLILASGLIETAYFLPRWQESVGARMEREACEMYGIATFEFAEAWLPDVLSQ